MKTMERKKIINVLITSILCCFVLTSFGQSNTDFSTQNSSKNSFQYVDLTTASANSVHAVVHIQTEFLKKTSAWEDFFGGSFWEDFFGDMGSTQYPVKAAGSGVLISPDGYILTNNHVVEDAQKVTVTLNDKKEYDAQIIGTDPFSDLALIKIEASSLPFLPFGNSDNVKVGEWVIAVGNPFNLTSTVTAGIVSAKARNLSILGEGNNGLESFIQTDAAVNQGNSGGALVNSQGELIGINTAIASGNGYYTGYSFAVPSNIARKVADDLKNHGFVQRAFLGVTFTEIDSKKAAELHLNDVKGILISEISEYGAASKTDMMAGDILLKFNNYDINSLSELYEVLYQYSPGNKVTLTYLHNDEIKKSEVELLNNKGSISIVENDIQNINELFGAEFKDLTDRELNYYRIKGGVKVESLQDGILANAGIKEGFIITAVNNRVISNITTFNEYFNKNTYTYITLEGVYDNGYYRYTYTIQMP